MANVKSENQIVDTHESLETRFNRGFLAGMAQINRTPLTATIAAPSETTDPNPGNNTATDSDAIGP